MGQRKDPPLENTLPNTKCNGGIPLLGTKTKSHEQALSVQTNELRSPDKGPYLNQIKSPRSQPQVWEMLDLKGLTQDLHEPLGRQLKHKGLVPDALVLGWHQEIWSLLQYIHVGCHVMSINGNWHQFNANNNPQFGV